MQNVRAEVVSIVRRKGQRTYQAALARLLKNAVVSRSAFGSEKIRKNKDEGRGPCVKDVRNHKTPWQR